MANQKNDDNNSLPEDCLAHVLSLTTPEDACRLSTVASIFCDASLSDTVWQRFLPSDYLEIISGAVDANSLQRFGSKKELYFHLCDNPILIDGGLMRFFLDKASGKKCYILSARYIFKNWCDHPELLRFSPSSISSSTSRFPEVAEIIQLMYLSKSTKIPLNMLSPSTEYAAYLIYKVNSSPDELGIVPAGILATINWDVYPNLNDYMHIRDGRGKTVCWFDEEELVNQRKVYRNLVGATDLDEDKFGDFLKVVNPKSRDDGWLEIELLTNVVGDGDYLEIVLGIRMRGILMHSVEVRPRSTSYT